MGTYQLRRPRYTKEGLVPAGTVLTFAEGEAPKSAKLINSNADLAKEPETVAEPDTMSGLLKQTAPSKKG